jgi:DNA-binding FadR family transcriptional regulator
VDTPAFAAAMTKRAPIDPPPPARARAPATEAVGPRYERVVYELTLRVVSREWPAGYLVPTENELCAHFGVSRTVVREAMRLLVDRGLMVVRKGKGTVVTRREQWDVLHPVILSEGLRHGLPDIAAHVMEARQLVEPAVVGLAALRATAAQRARLKELMEQLRQPTPDVDLQLDRGMQFHRALAAAGNNPLLERMLAPIYTALEAWHGARSLPASLQQTNHEDHEQLLATVLAGDAAGASAAAADHLSTVFGVVVRTTVARHGHHLDSAGLVAGWPHPPEVAGESG